MMTREERSRDTDLREATEVALMATDILPTEAKTSVLGYLLSMVTSETIKGLSLEGRKEILGSLQQYEDFLVPFTLGSRQRKFLSDYAVTYDRHAFNVVATIPAGKSCQDVVCEAELLIEALYDQCAMRDDLFDYTGSREDFKQIAAVATTISFEVNTRDMSRGDWLPVNANLRELVVGLLAYMVATGQDMLGGRSAVSKDGFSLTWCEPGYCYID